MTACGPGRRRVVRGVRAGRRDARDVRTGMASPASGASTSAGRAGARRGRRRSTAGRRRVARGAWRVARQPCSGVGEAGRERPAGTVATYDATSTDRLLTAGVGPAQSDVAAGVTRYASTGTASSASGLRVRGSITVEDGVELLRRHGHADAELRVPDPSSAGGRFHWRVRPPASGRTAPRRRAHSHNHRSGVGAEGLEPPASCL